MEIIWILIGFFALVTMLFIVIAIFLPEWVGITGKKALEIQKHQNSEISSKNTDSAASSKSDNI